MTKTNENTTSPRRAAPQGAPQRARRALLMGALAALLAAVPAAPALADVRTEARRHFRAGMALIQEGQVDAGVAELQVAYDILPHPNVLYNIGRAYAEAGRYEESLEYFEQYMESDPPDREEVRQFIAAIEARIAESAGPAVAEVQDPTTGPTEPGPSTPAASEEDIVALEDTATQIETLGITANDPSLIARAERLRAMAQELRNTRGQAEPGTEPGTEPGPATEPGTEPGPESGPGAEGRIGIAEGGQDLYDESVVSSTGAAQNPLDAPNAITIITAQDIRLTGITHIGELFRRVVGVDVMNITGADVQVGIRGFNQQLSPRVLVLINGRQAYVDALGANLFAYLPVAVEDIERVEILRGPASALYGANGFSGIINIITVAPGDRAETGVTLGGGMGGTLRAQAWSSGRSGRMSYRVSAGYEQYDRWERIIGPNRLDFGEPIIGPSTAIRSKRAFGSFSFRASENVSLNLEAGVNDGRFGFQAFGSFVDWQAEGPSTHLMGTLDSNWGSVRVWWNRLSIEHGVIGPDPLLGTFVSDTLDVDARFAHELQLGSTRHNVTLGVGYRWKRIDWTFFTQTPTEDHFRVVFQDAMQLAEPLQLVVGFRLDRHPILENLQFSPRIAMVLQPAEGHAIRASYSNAFRNQTLLETYMELDFPTPAPGVTARNFGSEIARQQLGQPALRPEFIQSVELGYRNASSDSFDMEVSVFYNRVERIISIGDLLPTTLSQFGSGSLGYIDSTASFPIGTTVFSNEPGLFHVFGTEVGGRLYPVDGLDIYANYTYNQTWSVDNPRRPEEERTSAHKFNAGVQYRLGIGLDLSVDFHYASGQKWLEETFDAESNLVSQLFAQPAYYLLNARIGYRLLDDALELGVTGFNITNNRHRQHPRGQQLEARVVASATYRF
ncbi:MAG: TonB-dependent receptor [Sandaracinaceae bacterium]|nr:TonB-dependent receptor [Sandaracinaceae bacterium]